MTPSKIAVSLICFTKNRLWKAGFMPCFTTSKRQNSVEASDWERWRPFSFIEIPLLIGDSGSHIIKVGTVSQFSLRRSLTQNSILASWLFPKLDVERHSPFQLFGVSLLLDFGTLLICVE